MNHGSTKIPNLIFVSPLPTSTRKQTSASKSTTGGILSPWVFGGFVERSGSLEGMELEATLEIVQEMHPPSA